MATEKDSALSITVGLTWKFSGPHLAAAAFFTRKVAEIEKDFETARIEKFPGLEHRWYYFSSIIMAFSSIEANLNEILREVAKLKSKGDILELEYAQGFELKCKKIYKAIVGRPLDSKNPEYLDAKILNELRNALIHPRPITHWGNKGVWETSYDEESKLDKAKKRLEDLPEALKQLGLKPNPRYKTNPFFPDQVISHGYAEWAVKTAYKFIALFRNDSGLGMDNFKGDFKTR